MVEPNKTTVSDNSENGAHNMVKLIIDNCEVVVPEHTTILDAAKSVGIQIPTLCYLKDINEIGACRICMVEVEGEQRLVAACDTQVGEGIVVHTNSPRVREARRVNLRRDADHRRPHRRHPGRRLQPDPLRQTRQRRQNQAPAAHQRL